MQTNTLDLVGQIYDAVSEPEGWDSFLGNLAATMGAHAARMRMVDKRNNNFGLIAGAGHDSAFDQHYADYYTKVDLFNPILAQQNVGAAFDSHHLIPDETFYRSEIYNDLFRQYDYFYGLGGNILKSDNIISRIGVHRSRTQGPYSDQDLSLLNQLMPHLTRAFKLGTHLQELKSKQEGMEDALYRSSTPLILIDEYESVAFINQRAESLLNGNNNLTIINNHLQLLREVEQLQLHKLIHQAVATGARKGTKSGGAIRVTSETGEQRYNLIITPYPSRSTSHLGLNTRICAAVFIHDTRQASKLSSDLLKTLYKLTPSEIRLAEGVVDGLTPAEAATKFGVSINTTRSQLRSLFAKTDTQRQAELVRLLTGFIGR